MGPPLPIRKAVDGLRVSLEASARCLRPDDLTAVVDSVLNEKLAGRDDLDEWFARYPLVVREALARCDPRAESGTETYVRLRLRRRHIRLRTQVKIDDIGRVDLLVGDRLVIEVDSRAHHTSAVAYENDRERDRRLRALGYHVIRLTYDQVLNRWEEAEPDLLAVIRRGDHRWARQRVRPTATRTG